MNFIEVHWYNSQSVLLPVTMSFKKNANSNYIKIMYDCANGRTAKHGLIIFWNDYFLVWLTTFIIFAHHYCLSEVLRLSINMIEDIDLLQSVQSCSYLKFLLQVRYCNIRVYDSSNWFLVSPRFVSGP